MRTFTARANAYLERLERVSVPPLTQVRDALLQQVSKIPESWLSFHERFGGYVQLIGGVDRSAWGLMHYESVWLKPLACTVEDMDDDGELTITCADVHPSYEYILTMEGHLLGAAESFDVQVERWALEVAFKRDAPNGVKSFRALDALPADTAQLVTEVLDQAVVPEASDSYSQAYCNANALVIRTEEQLRGWLRR